MRILLIEDDIQLSFAIINFFEDKNYEIVSVKDGEKALSFIDSQKFDLYLIDINLPNINGIDLLKYIRKTNILTPIVILTASLEITNLTNAFEYGCSEYIKKPFHFKELEVRVNKLLNTNSSNIDFGNEFIYYKDKRKFYYKNQLVELRKKENRFLEILVENLNKTITTEQITDYVWENEIKDNYPLRQLVNGLRKKLPSNIVKTDIGEGYRIEITSS